MSKERDLLKKIHYCWVCATDLDDEDPEIKALNDVMREAEHYLFHEPESEPVRYMVVNEQGETSFLYTRPEPARKPMTEEEIKELCPFTRQEFVTGFKSGIRFAEKHHDILEKHCGL